jgi:hypothetical protein
MWELRRRGMLRHGGQKEADEFAGDGRPGDRGAACRAHEMPVAVMQPLLRPCLTPRACPDTIRRLQVGDSPTVRKCSFGVREAGCSRTVPAQRMVSMRPSVRDVDRILKGSKPTDLAAMQPTRYSRAVNLGTACGWG